MITKLITCSPCGSDKLVKHGLTKNQKQRYFCHHCQRSSREAPQPNGYTEEQRAEILRAYEERSSLRGLTRTFGVARNTARAMVARKTLPALSATFVAPPEPARWELAELWSFVLKKAKQ